MLHASLASNPYALSILLAAIAFIGGALMNKKFKYAVVLAMITLNSLVLCQYAHRLCSFYYASVPTLFAVFACQYTVSHCNSFGPYAMRILHALALLRPFARNPCIDLIDSIFFHAGVLVMCMDIDRYHLSFHHDLSSTAEHCFGYLLSAL